MTRCAIWTLAIALSLLMTSCGGDSGSGPDDTGTGVIADQSIEDGDSDVSLAAQAWVEFRDRMDDSTIDDSTFFVRARDVEGHVEYDSATRRASFTPDALYAADTSYELVVSGNIENDQGQPLGNDRTISFTTGSLDCEGIADHLEPNDTWDTARAVDLDRWYRTLTLCEDDCDFYAFTVDDTVKVTTTAYCKHSAGVSWWIGFVAADGQNYYSSWNNSAAGDTARQYYTFHPGTYMTAVSSPNDPMYFTYDLMLETGDPCHDDPYEDNDFMADAASVQPGHFDDLRACLHDIDWFAFDAAAGETLEVSVHVDDLAGTTFWTLDVYDPEGTHLDGGIASTPDYAVECTAASSGEHFVRVIFQTEGVRYDMDIDVSR